MRGGLAKGRTALLAAAAGALFLAGEVRPALAAEGDEAKVKCEGVNACKGQSDCSTASNGCAGQNACKGKGFLTLTKAECDAAKARMEKEEEKEG